MCACPTFERSLPVIVADEVSLVLLLEAGLQHGVAGNLGHVDGGQLPHLNTNSSRTKAKSNQSASEHKHACNDEEQWNVRVGCGVERGETGRRS